MKASELAQLRTENRALHEQVQVLLQHVALQQAELAQAHARLAEQEQRPPDPSAFVKPNTPPRAPTPRRQRAAHHNRGRHFDVPTEIVQHALTHCPA